MSITASLVKELREMTGAGMMECKKALTEVDGDLQAAQEYLRKKGQASAEKKSGRIAAEGRIELAMAADAAAIVEVNCETDFVAKDENFLTFARQTAGLVLADRPDDVTALMALDSDGETLEARRNALVAKIGEKIDVRRFSVVVPKGRIAHYVHGVKIGVLVDLEGGDEELGKDIAMHVAATNPQYISADDVDAGLLDKERRFLSEQAEQEGKPAEIVEKMVAGRCASTWLKLPCSDSRSSRIRISMSANSCTRMPRPCIGSFVSKWARASRKRSRISPMRSRPRSRPAAER